MFVEDFNVSMPNTFISCLTPTTSLQMAQHVRAGCSGELQNIFGLIYVHWRSFIHLLYKLVPEVMVVSWSPCQLSLGKGRGHPE